MAPNGETGAFPPVVLDKTLHDLLLEGQKGGTVEETVCKVKPNSDHQYGEAVPLSDKYIIHSAQTGSADDLAHLQLENCCHLLMFFVGPMKVIFLGAEGRSNDPTLSKQAVDENARRSFGIIEKSQQPKITTYANLEDCVKNHDGSKIRWGFAMDFAERLPSLFSPELVYKLNSKRWLAVCPLRSANDEVIDCEIKCPSHHTSNEEWYYGGPDCPNCTTGIEAETKRVGRVLEERTLPFVLKLTQSLSAVGTNIVKTEEDRTAIVDKMKTYLRNWLPRVTEENTHLYTTTLILSDHIDGPTMALNFFVNQDGSVVFLGACHQLATGESGRQATAITYADQKKLESKYRESVDRIGKVLHDEGYYGMVGADIMEDPDSKRLFAIDLNVRSPLSLLLYLLRGHFNDQRGFGVSLIYECVMLTISRDEMEKRFAKEFQEARIILLGSTRMGEKEQWAYGMVLAGEDKEQVDKVSDRILEFEADAEVEE